jgi:hypothetical protein
MVSFVFGQDGVSMRGQFLWCGRRILTAIFCLGLFSWPARAGNEFVDLNRLKANPVLREALAANCPFPAARGNRSRGASDLYRERWIDGQIEYFAQEVQSRLEATRDSLADAREAWSVYTIGESVDQEVTGRFRDAIRTVENNTKSLSRFIAARILMMKRRKVKAVLPEDAGLLPFELEIGFLERQLEKTEAQIWEGFLVPKNVVGLKELTDANVLERLHLMEQTAKRVRGNLK